MKHEQRTATATATPRNFPAAQPHWISSSGVIVRVLVLVPVLARPTKYPGTSQFPGLAIFIANFNFNSQFSILHSQFSILMSDDCDQQCGVLPCATTLSSSNPWCMTACAPMHSDAINHLLETLAKDRRPWVGRFVLSPALRSRIKASAMPSRRSPPGEKQLGSFHVCFVMICESLQLAYSSYRSHRSPFLPLEFLIKRLGSQPLPPSLREETYLNWMLFSLHTYIRLYIPLQSS